MAFSWLGQDMIVSCVCIQMTGQVRSIPTQFTLVTPCTSRSCTLVWSKGNFSLTSVLPLWLLILHQYPDIASLKTMGNKVHKAGLGLVLDVDLSWKCMFVLQLLCWCQRWRCKFSLQTQIDNQFTSIPVWCVLVSRWLEEHCEAFYIMLYFDNVNCKIGDFMGSFCYIGICNLWD